MPTLKQEIAELRAELAKVKSSSERDERFQGLWPLKSENGTKYCGGMVVTPDGSELWAAIYPNKYFKKGKKRPKFHLTLDIPMEKKDK